MDLVRIVKKHTREEDMIGKSNGEIGIILPETDQAGSKTLLQRLLRIIHADPQFKSDEILRSRLQSPVFSILYIPESVFRSGTFKDSFGGSR